MSRLVWTELRTAARSLVRAPAFSLMVVSCLALGTGATSTAFRMLDALLVRVSPAVREPERLARLYFDRGAASARRVSPARTSRPVFEDVKNHARSFEGVAAVWETDVSIGRTGEVRGARAAFVSDDYFSVLGVRPAAGRFFSAVGASGGRTPTAVVTWDYWQRALDGRLDASDARIVVNGRTLTVLGVVPAVFRGTEAAAVDVWLPLGLAGQFGLDEEVYEARDATWLRMFARLRPGLTPTVAAGEVARIVQGGNVSQAAREAVTVAAGPLNEGLGPRRGAGITVGLWVLGITALLLLVTCANVAALALSRAVSRRGGVAIRLALGARPRDVARYVLAESLLLAAAAALAGTAVAVLLSHLITRLGVVAVPPADLRLFAVTFGVAALAWVAFGVGPVIHATTTTASAVLRPTVTETTSGSSRGAGAVRHALFVGQIALTSALVAGALLFARAFRSVSRVDLGIETDHLLVASVAEGGHAYRREEWHAMLTSMRDRAGELPFVQSVSLGILPPFRGLMLVGVAVPGEGTSGMAVYHVVEPTYFRTIGRRLLQGRDFTQDDRTAANPVAVIDETMAREYWPRGGALGRCFEYTSAPVPGGCATVVGIVAPGKYAEVREEPTAAFFLPLAQQRPGVATTVFMRVAGNPALFVRTVQRELQGTSATLPYVTVEPASALVDPQRRPWRIGVGMFGMLGSLALVLSGLAVYGLVSLHAVQRQREIAIRLALGSPRRRVIALILRRVLALAGGGLCLGAVLAGAGARRLASTLPGLAAGDPVVFGLVPLTLVGFAVAAVWTPAWRAVRTDPLSVLRDT